MAWVKRRGSDDAPPLAPLLRDCAPWCRACCEQQGAVRCGISRDGAEFAQRRGCFIDYLDTVSRQKVRTGLALLEGVASPAAAAYWDPSPAGVDDPTQVAVDGRFREYLRPAGTRGTRDNQNRSTLGWVRIGTTFTFALDVINLSLVELGRCCGRCVPTTASSTASAAASRSASAASSWTWIRHAPSCATGAAGGTTT